MGTGMRSKSEIPAKMSGRSCNRKVQEPSGRTGGTASSMSGFHGAPSGWAARRGTTSPAGSTAFFAAGPGAILPMSFAFRSAGGMIRASAATTLASVVPGKGCSPSR